MSLIQLKHASKSFGSQHVLRDITLDVREGETLVLIGESGCGKSVTMKLMMDLLEPTQGEVLWDGKPIRSRSEKQITRERLKFGYLFQQAALFDSLTVFENVAFGLRQNKRLPEKQVVETVHGRLRDVGLSPDVVVDKKPAELSGGMRKRVGLARALAMSPAIMLYDEPTTGLDPIMSDVINELMIRTRDRYAVTSIIVTHDMNTASWIPDLFMKRVAEDGPWTLFSPDETGDLHDLTGAAFEAAYIRYEEKAARGEMNVAKTLKANDLWRKMLGMLFETGHPWVTFKDPCNIRYTNQHIGVVHSSNLCTEITLHTNDNEIAVCNLGSVNLAAHTNEDGLDLDKLRKTVSTAMRSFDKILGMRHQAKDISL